MILSILHLELMQLGMSKNRWWFQDMTVDDSKTSKIVDETKPTPCKQGSRKNGQKGRNREMTLQKMLPKRWVTLKRLNFSVKSKKHNKTRILSWNAFFWLFFYLFGSFCFFCLSPDAHLLWRYKAVDYKQLLHHEGNYSKSRTSSNCKPHFKLFGHQKPCSMPIGKSFLEGLNWQWSTMADFSTSTFAHQRKNICQYFGWR